MKKKTPKRPKPKAKTKTRPKPKPRPKPKGKAKSFSKLTQYAVIQKSPFLVALRNVLFDSNGDSQIPAGGAQASTAIPDLQRALEMMFLVADLKIPTASATPGFAEQTIINLRASVPWPDATNADVHPDWNTTPGNIRAFRLWEVAWAVNYFLEAIAKSGGGGGGKPNWPPPPPP